MRLAPLFLCLAACGANTPCDLSGLEGGAVRGTVDGVGWDTTGAAWSPTGDGVQIVTSAGGGYRVTFSLQATADGQPLGAAIEAGELPIEVSFDDDTTAFALLYPDAEPGSLSSKGSAGGHLTIEAIDGDVLGACFAFEASSTDRTAAVEGALSAAPL